MSVAANDPGEVTRRILGSHGHSRGGPRAIFLALTRTRRGQIGLILLALYFPLYWWRMLEDRNLGAPEAAVEPTSGGSA